jgi:hypothetical protein
MESEQNTPDDPIEQRLLAIWKAQNADFPLSSSTASFRELGVNSLRLSIFLFEVIETLEIDDLAALSGVATSMRALAASIRSIKLEPRPSQEAQNGV